MSPSELTAHFFASGISRNSDYHHDKDQGSAQTDANTDGPAESVKSSTLGSSSVKGQATISGYAGDSYNASTPSASNVGASPASFVAVKSSTSVASGLAAQAAPAVSLPVAAFSHFEDAKGGIPSAVSTGATGSTITPTPTAGSVTHRGGSGFFDVSTPAAGSPRAAVPRPVGSGTPGVPSPTATGSTVRFGSGAMSPAPPVVVMRQASGVLSPATVSPTSSEVGRRPGAVTPGSPAPPLSVRQLASMAPAASPMSGLRSPTAAFSPMAVFQRQQPQFQLQYQAQVSPASPTSSVASMASQSPVVRKSAAAAAGVGDLVGARWVAVPSYAALVPSGKSSL